MRRSTHRPCARNKNTWLLLTSGVQGVDLFGTYSVSQYQVYDGKSVLPEASVLNKVVFVLGNPISLL